MSYFMKAAKMANGSNFPLPGVYGYRASARIIAPRIVETSRRIGCVHAETPRRSAGAATEELRNGEVRRHSGGAANRCAAVTVHVPRKTDARIEDLPVVLHRTARCGEALITGIAESGRGSRVDLALHTLREQVIVEVIGNAEVLVQREVGFPSQTVVQRQSRV